VNVYLFIYLFISLIHQQSHQTVAAKGIRQADGKARPTGTYSFPDVHTDLYIILNTQNRRLWIFIFSAVATILKIAYRPTNVTA